MKTDNSSTGAVPETARPASAEVSSGQRARRGFLAGAGVAGAAGAAALVLKPAVQPQGGAEQGAAPQVQAPAGRGYQLSEHVRKYYDTTKV